MKNLKLIALIGVAISGQLLFAQDQNSNSRMVSGEIYAKPETGAPAQGSQYFNDNFVTAKLLEDNLMMIRYNAYSDQIEVQKPDLQIGGLIPQKDFVITTSDLRYNYEYVSYTTEKNENVTGYLNRIANLSNIKLYSRMRIILQRESAPSNGYQQYKPATYKQTPITYLIKIKDGSIVELPTNKKKVGKLFPGKEDKVSDFINNNKISLTQEADIKRLADFLNTL